MAELLFSADDDVWTPLSEMSNERLLASFQRCMSFGYDQVRRWWWPFGDITTSMFWMLLANQYDAEITRRKESVDIKRFKHALAYIADEAGDPDNIELNELLRRIRDCADSALATPTTGPKP